MFTNTLKVLRTHPLKVKLFIMFFFAVGVVAIYIPYSSAFFISLTPFALMLSLFFLLVFHKKFDLKHLWVFLTIFIIGFLVEMIGTNTGLIFGFYKYGPTLGISLWNTPLMIGLNWVMVIYLTASIIRKLKLSKPLTVLIASILTVGYDLVLEQLAPKMMMWTWKGDTVPFKNYVAWFLLSLIFHSLVQYTNIKTKNKLALVIFATQLMFFVLLLFK